MSRWTVVIPREQAERARELAAYLSGEDVVVVVDRRCGERGTGAPPSPFGRRAADRRMGTWPATPSTVVVSIQS